MALASTPTFSKSPLAFTVSMMTPMLPVTVEGCTKNGVGRHRQVVASGGRDIHHRSNDGNFLVGFERLELVVQNVRGIDGSARTVDPHDDSLDLLVLRRLGQLFLERRQQIRLRQPALLILRADDA